MSLNLPSRRALRAAASASLRPSTATTALCNSMQCLSLASTVAARPVAATAGQLVQRRNLFGWGRKSKPAKSEQEEKLAFSKEIEKQRQTDVERFQKKLMSANLNTSIFAEELEASKPSDQDAKEAQQPPTAAAPGGSRLHSGGMRNYEAMARSTDPDPRSRVRWQRKMVARMVARGLDPRGRETHEELIARTERRYVSRGPLLHTSTKKIVHLARQVAGKTVEEAMVQMRFSKKKWARELGLQLHLARDEATVVAGMGLGRAGKEPGEDEFEPVKFQTKDGKWITIDEPTNMYIEQAWVNRGPFHNRYLTYRARGRSDQKWDSSSNITLVVKEEKTRIREHEESQAKKAKRTPWLHHPNRPITAQRQHYSW